MITLTVHKMDTCCPVTMVTRSQTWFPVIVSRLCRDSFVYASDNCVYAYLDAIDNAVSCHGRVMGVIKMGNTVPRVGLKPTSSALWASVLLLHHAGFPEVTTIVRPTCVCVAPCLRGQCRPLHL